MRAAPAVAASTLLFALLAGSCASRPAAAPDAEPAAAAAPTAPDGLNLEIAAYDAVPGWGRGGEAAALRAFRRTCPRFDAMGRNQDVGPAYAGEARFWQEVCAAAALVPDGLDSVAQTFFEARFTPLRVTPRAGASRKTTAYYEPEFDVAWVRDSYFSEPIMARPADLVDVEVREANHAGGGRRDVFVKGADGALRLAPARAAYRARGKAGGALAYGRLGDVVFLQIQGSGRIKYPDGAVWRAAYAGHNGRAYTSIGAEILARGHVRQDRLNADDIKVWMATAPVDDVESVIDSNERYVFFKLVEVADPTAGPVGAAGVALEAGASVAVDPAWHAYGALVFVAPSGPGAPRARLAVAQDTGGAIKGPLRSDIFWGTGVAAGQAAGRVNHDADWWVLVPNAQAYALRAAGAAS